MKTLILIFVIVEVFLTARYFSFVGTQWYLFSLRNSACIERFRQKQKAGDVIMANYNTTAALTHLWGAIMLMPYIFNFSISSTATLLTACVVIALLLLQIVCRHIIDKKYDLRDFYNAVVEFKRKEDVIRLIDEKGLLTDELKVNIMKCSKLVEIEDIYRPFKEKKKTKATEAIKNGLEPLAKIIMSFPKNITGVEKFLNENIPSEKE